MDLKSNKKYLENCKNSQNRFKRPLLLIMLCRRRKEKRNTTKKGFSSSVKVTYSVPSGLRPFWATKSPLIMIKNAFYFTLKPFPFYFCLEILVRQQKRLHWRDKVNFKIYNVIAWLNNNYNRHTDQYPKKQRQSGNKIWSITRI